MARGSALLFASLCLSCASEPLTYALPQGCELAYRMRVWESPEVAEADDEYLFSIEARSPEMATVRWGEREGPLQVRRRSLDLSPTRIGPAAPDVACRDRVHDPFEDFVALAFPQLSSQGAQSWSGAPVVGDGSTCTRPGSCCAALSCGVEGEVEPSPARLADCQLGSWREERRSAKEPPQVRSTWSNGRKGPKRADSERFVDFDGPHGRPLRARVDLHPAPGRSRRVEIVALDACNGIQPLATDAGAQERLAQIRAWAPPSEGGQRVKRTQADGQDRH